MRTSGQSRALLALNVDDPPVAGPEYIQVFERILDRKGLDIVLLELDGEILGATYLYLNLILNLPVVADPTQSSRTS